MDSANGSGIAIRIAQAQGIVSVQAGCTVDEAMVLMEARAAISHVTMVDLSAAILDHSIDFLT